MRRKSEGQTPAKGKRGRRTSGRAYVERLPPVWVKPNAGAGAALNVKGAPADDAQR